MRVICSLRQRFGRHIPNQRKYEIISNCHVECDKQQIKRTKKVIVVGGGFAGCYTGWLLNRAGFRVKILEATDKVGGRVQSVYKPKGRVIEAGAEFINGFDKHWIFLARKFGLSLNEIITDEQFANMGLDNTMILDDIIIPKEDMAELESNVNKVLMKISEHANIITYPDEPWLEPEDIRKLDNISIGEIFDEWKVEGLTRQLLDISLQNDNVSSVYEQSWLGFLCHIKGSCPNTQEYWDLLETFRCAQGNVSLAEKLVYDLDVRYESPVVKIRKRKSHITVYTSVRKYRADYLVLAVPPSVWSSIEFFPKFDLDSYYPNLGKSMKNINICSEPFWVKENQAPTAVNSDIGLIWSPTAGQTIYPGQKVVLSVFTGGPYVKDIMDQKYVDDNMNKTLPGFIAYRDSSYFIKHHMMPFIKTGYSFAGVGRYLTVMYNLNQKPEYDGHLIFAGEHTSPDTYGFMEGALKSGYHAAQFIINNL